MVLNIASVAPEAAVITETIVDFVKIFPTGQLKICKVAGPGMPVGTQFNFTVVSRLGTQQLTVPAGPASQERIGELLPVRVTENELIVYGPDVKEIARHELYPSGIIGKKRSLPAHSPGRDHQQKRELLRQRFAEFGPEGVRFFDELLRARRNGKDEAARVLGLLTVYRREDLMRALERAGRYRAFSWSAVERILAAQAKPRSAMEALTIEAREQLDEMLRQIPLAPRSTAEYQALLEETAKDEENHESEDDGPDDPTA